MMLRRITSWLVFALLFTIVVNWWVHNIMLDYGDPNEPAVWIYYEDVQGVDGS